MSDSERDTRATGIGLASPSSDTARRKAPRLVLGGGTGFAAQVADHFRRLGWDVHTAPTGCAARRLALRKNPHAVVLPAEYGTESGFLTCAKLTADRPRLKVVLVGGDRTPAAERFADFVGASAVVAEADGLGKLVKAVLGTTPPSEN